MDKTEQNIKMCEKAVKIQEAWEPKEGDYAYSQRGGVYVLFTQVILIGDALGRFKFDHTWLPRQYQLQAMVVGGLAKKIESFYFFCLDVSRFDERYMELISLDGDAERLNNKSMEQLWLAFVMQAKFNKTWNGKDWT